jgi:hypothetical protein
MTSEVSYPVILQSMVKHDKKQCFTIGLGGLPVFRFYFQTGFFGLAFTKTGKPSLRNCLLSSPETRS